MKMTCRNLLAPWKARCTSRSGIIGEGKGSTGCIWGAPRRVIDLDKARMVWGTTVLMGSGDATNTDVENINRKLISG